MFEILPEGPVAEYSPFINALYAFAWAALLSCLIAIVHRLTYTGEHYPKSLFQALVLGAIVTSLVVMAIGDSLARGLGVFGAMSIIRFRTRIESARDVVFLFAAISTGLAIGVFGYAISFVGTAVFCAVALTLHFTNFRTYTEYKILDFTIQDATLLTSIEELIRTHSLEMKQTSAALKGKNWRYEYSIIITPSSSADQLIQALHQKHQIEGIKVSEVQTIN